MVKDFILALDAESTTLHFRMIKRLENVSRAFLGSLDNEAAIKGCSQNRNGLFEHNDDSISFPYRFRSIRLLSLSRSSI